MPVLLPEIEGEPTAIADSTQILRFLERHQPDPTYFLADAQRQTEAALLEDWLDESIGTATRFVYYDFRRGDGKQIDPSLSSQLVIQVVRWQYDMNPAAVELARQRLAIAFDALADRWKTNAHLVGNQLSVADIAAAALLSPLALIPYYRQQQAWLFERIREIHQLCGEPLPPGLRNEG